MLIHISEVNVLAIRQVIKCMHHLLINHTIRPRRRDLSLQRILLLILSHQVPSEEYDINDQENVTPHMRSKGNEVTGFIVAEENLRAYSRSEGGAIKWWELNIPIAFPVAHAMKLTATTMVFLVWPAMFRDIMLIPKVWAAQKLSTI
jgi:hypothetical protein